MIMYIAKVPGVCRNCGRLLALVAVVSLVTGCGPEEEKLPLDPETSRLLTLSEQALEHEAFEHALALADSAARRVPDAVEPEFLKGLIYSRMLQWEEAEAAYKRVIDLDPKYPGVWNNLGNNALRQSRYRSALTYYEQELALKPASAPWHAVGQAYLGLGILDSASYAFNQAAALDSTYAPAYLSLAEVLDREGEYERALAAAERAYALEPNAPATRSAMGSLLMRIGRFSEAIPHLEAATRAMPWNADPHYKLGQVLQRLGRDDESRALLAHAEKLRQLHADVVGYQKALITDPKNPYAHAALATAYRLAGRYKEALTAYKLALTLEPDNLEFLNNVASLHFLQKDTTAAILTYQYILENDPEMVEVWVNLGILHALSGEKERARQAWENALRYEPDNEQARTYLARLER